MKTFLQTVERLESHARREVLDRFGNHSVLVVETAGPTAWLPAQLNVDLTHAVVDVLGPSESELFFRNMLSVVYDTSLFSGFVRGVVRLMGRDPGAYLKWIAKGYGLAFKDAGTWLVAERGDGHAVLELADLPPPFEGDEVWLSTVAASMGSLLDLAQKRGDSWLELLEDGRARIMLRWSSR